MPLLAAISLLSAAALSYEILLMRLFSIVLWHHFAYMAISLALLGYGASGTALSLTRAWALARFRGLFSAAAVLFGVCAVAAFAAAQALPFNPLELVWDPRQWLYLAALYFVLAVPFFCVALCICLAYMRYQDRIGTIYFADLIGAGAGALALVALLFVLAPERALALLGGAGAVAAGLVCLDAPRRPRAAVALIVAGVALPFLWPDAVLTLRPSPYKQLSQALQVPDTEVVARRSSPLGALSVVRSPTIPFRHAPGLSLMSPGGVPDQLGIFTDGGSMTAIGKGADAEDAFAYLDFTGAALPYHLLERPRVLVLGAGGGDDVRLARLHGARSIDAVELDPQMVDLVRRQFGDYAGRILDQPEVTVHVAEGRGFIARGDAPYDLIQLSLMESFAASMAGLFALNQSTLYTVEAFEAYLRRLAPGGYLAITRWLKVPPRDSLKLVVTAAQALERAGVAEPARRLALVRGWSTATLLVRNGDLGDREIAAIRAFADARAFDLAVLPGLAASEANRYNRFEEPYLFEGARALLGPDRDAFIGDYKFDLEPASDDRPYFFHFFRWRALPELMALRTTGGMALVEWGYLILVATLVQALAFSVVLILVPLALLRRSGATKGQFGRTFVYFAALGLAFLFVEIAFIERFTLFLSHPLYAIAVVLCAFLVFAGLGSGVSARFAERAGGWAVVLAVAAIAAVAILYILLLPGLFAALRPWADLPKVLVSLALIAPLAFFMGMPFPIGLSRLGEAAPGLVPWAWGINGCASVLSAVLATVLAIEWGFTVVVLLALLLYGLAAAEIRRL
jgi:hypothetical protein